MITIYHNPRCSKSRATLALASQIATERNLDLAVVDYQKTPLTLPQLTELSGQLRMPVDAMVRDNEDDYATLNLAGADDSTLLQALAAHPKLLQRPIIVYSGRATIGRPPENIHNLFTSA